MKSHALYLALFVVFLSPMAALAQRPLLVGIQCYNKGCKIEELENVLTEAYARAGERVEFRYLPPKRLTEEARQEGIDGYGIITEAEARTTGLIIVKQPIGKASLVAFSAYKGRNIKVWDDLNGLTVGTVRGSILLQEDSLDGLNIRRYRFNDARSAFSMLQEGRLDVILGDVTAGTLLARQMKLQVYPSPPLKTVALYHAVSRRHAKLAPKLANALKGMIEDGTMEKLLGQFKKILTNKPNEKTDN